MKQTVIFLASLLVISLSSAQNLELESAQAYSSYLTSGSDNGSVVVMRNTTRDLEFLNNTFDQIFLGTIVFGHLANGTPGHIYYAKYTFPPASSGGSIHEMSDQLKFNIDGVVLMSLTNYSLDGGSTYSQTLRMSNGARCSEGGVWEDASSAELKNLGSVLHGGDLIERIRKLPLYHWAYKSQPGERHIGPTAEDFSELFSVGSSNKRIAALDLGGLSLVAVQALIEELDALKTQVSKLTVELMELRESQ